MLVPAACMGSEKPCPADGRGSPPSAHLRPVVMPSLLFIGTGTHGPVFISLKRLGLRTKKTDSEK